MNGRMKRGFIVVTSALLILLCGVFAYAEVCSWGDWVVDVEASCQQAGHRYRVCDASEYPHIEEEILPKLSHQYQITIKQATCHSAGKRISVCSVCNDYKEETIAEPLRHEYVKKETIAATCTKEGIEIYRCRFCGESKTEKNAEALGHDPIQTVVREATCMEKGLNEIVCTRCGEIKKEETNPIAHQLEQNILAATCAADGQIIHTCVMCGEKKTEAGEAKLEHQYQIKTIAENDYDTIIYTCSLCGHNYSEQQHHEIMNTMNIALSSVNFGSLLFLLLLIVPDLHVLRWHKQKKQRNRRSNYK